MNRLIPWALHRGVFTGNVAQGKRVGRHGSFEAPVSERAKDRLDVSCFKQIRKGVILWADELDAF